MRWKKSMLARDSSASLLRKFRLLRPLLLHLSRILGLL